jgi:ribosomal protein L11 methyltransferase
MKYTQVAITTTDATQHEILIALLANIGFEGFEEMDNEVKAFIKEEELDTAVLDEIVGGLKLKYVLSTIEQQNWNAQWESSFDPVIVEDFAAVRAEFHRPVTGVKHEIIITPKMSFGTGHHATTYLMMQQMSHINFIGKSVFDFGTGTGVLAILAEKMGAAKVDAIDIDEWSVENTIENMEANSCHKIKVELASVISTTNQYDIIFANINLNVLLENMKDITAVCRKGGLVLFSGILSTDKVLLTDTAALHGLNFIRITEKNNWLCIVAEN